MVDRKKIKLRYGINTNHILTVSDSADTEDLILKNGTLEHADLSNRTHKNSYIQACSLSSVNFLCCNLSGSKIDRVIMEDSRLSGIDVTSSILVDAIFKNCRINDASFRAAKLKRVVFDECDLMDASFQSGDLEKVVFRSCNLSQTDFSNAKFKDIDIKGSRLNGAKFGLEQLQNLTIDQAQATYIALLTGVKID